MKVNFGGFIPLSTVDWFGRAVCTVFFRGCPVRCSYCHNREIQDGEDWREVEEVVDMIRSSRMLVSGVVFSGGEPTLQRGPLLLLAAASRAMGLKVGVQTNGVYPDTLEALLHDRTLDRVALDVKARWERYDNLIKRKFTKSIRRSLALCGTAYREGRLMEFEVVITLFRGYEDEVKYIAKEIEGESLVLQQGVEGTVPPLSSDEMRRIADRLGRIVKIRSRSEGEILYDGRRNRRVSGER